jgi:putative two-component system response regulator
MIAPDLKNAQLLVVDDEDVNVHLLERFLQRWGFTNVLTTTDSAQTVALCRQCRPDLLLLDLQMPDPDGFRLLELLAEEIHGPAHLPVLVLTADITPEAKQRALSSGARDFVTKPFDAAEIQLRVRNLLETRRLQLELQSANDTLEQRVETRTRELDTARLETLERLALAGEYRDDNTHEHAQRVGRTAALLAAMLGWLPDEVELIRRAAPLHDIGKIGIPDAILLKPAKLDADEFELMKSHTLIGHQILTGSASEILQLSAEIALTHHEHWDGKGYPHGRAGDEIPVSGRLTAVADVFDALTHRRPYKEAWPLDATLAEMRVGSGRHFEPALIEAFEMLDPRTLLSPVGGMTSGSQRPAAVRSMSAAR